MTTTIETTKAPLAKTNGVAVKQLSHVDELDKAVAEVRDLKTRASSTAWDLGDKIAHLFETKLWEQRKVITAAEPGEGDKPGKPAKESPAYSNWAQFCNSELALSATQANKLMDISKAFSRDHVLTYGTAKLGLALQVPVEDREKLLKEHAKSSKRQVASAVKQAKAEGKAPERRETGRKKMPKGKAAGQRASDAAKGIGDKVLVADLTRTITMQMWAEGHVKGKDEQEKRASKLSENPLGYAKIVDGLMIYGRLVEGEKGLELKLSIKKVDENGVPVKG